MRNAPSLSVYGIYFRRVCLIVALASISFGGVAVAQSPLEGTTFKVTYCYPFNQDRHVSVMIDAIMPNWRSLTSLGPLDDAARVVAERDCKAVKAPSAIIMKITVEVKSPRGPTVLRAEWPSETRTMRVTWDNRVNASRLENQERASEDAARAESDANDKRRQVAIADCGNGPKFSGGPWFSSTYSVAANDEARRAQQSEYFCLKAIEYVSAAPNPFGGNAARVRFSGYSKNDFRLLVQVRDFAY